MLVAYGVVAAYVFGLLMNLSSWPFALGIAVPGSRGLAVVRARRAAAGEPAPLRRLHAAHLHRRVGHRPGDHQHGRDRRARPGVLATLRRASRRASYGARQDGPVSLLPFEIPPGFAAYGEPRCRTGRDVPRRAAALVRDLVEEWSLTLDGDPRHGHCAPRRPGAHAAGRPAVLKLTLPARRGRARAPRPAALARPTATVAAAAAPTRTAGRCCSSGCTPTRTSPTCGTLEACEVVAGLYARLHVPALPQLRRLSSYVARWTERLARAARATPRAAPARGAGGVARPRPRRPTRRPTRG